MKSKTYAAAAVADADGIKTTFNTSTSVVELTESDWNGVVLNASAVLDLPRTVTITLGNNVGQFSTDDIVLTGLRGGSVVTETLNASSVNGNETLRGTQIFDQLTGVSLPAMAGTTGTITIGVQDICAPYGCSFSQVDLVADGTLNLGWGPDHAVAATDAIPVTVAVEESRETDARRVLTSSALAAPTTVGLTVYY